MRADRTIKIKIQENKQISNSVGEITDVWVDFTDYIYSSKEPILGREFFSAEAVQSKVELKFRTYFVAGVKNDMRIVDSEGIYQIISVINFKNQNRELLFYAREVV